MNMDGKGILDILGFHRATDMWKFPLQVTEKHKKIIIIYSLGDLCNSQEARKLRP